MLIDINYYFKNKINLTYNNKIHSIFFFLLIKTILSISSKIFKQNKFDWIFISIILWLMKI